MEKLFEVFRDSFPTNPTDADPNLEINAAVVVSDFNEEDLLALKQQMAEKNFRLGKCIGAGSTAVAFDLETVDGKKVDSAIVRLEAKQIAGNADHPLVPKPVARLEGDFYSVQIMPRTVDAEASKEDMERTLSGLNTKELLPQIWDLKKNSFRLINKPDGKPVSYRDRKPVFILGDTNAITKAKPDHKWIKRFANEQGMNIRELQRIKMPKEELAHVQAQMDEIYMQVARDVGAAGIKIDEGFRKLAERASGEHRLGA